MRPTVFQKHIGKKIKDKFNNPHSRIIKRKKIREVLYNSHIPVVLHQRFLEEMEKCGLIKIKDKQNIEILFKE